MLNLNSIFAQQQQTALEFRKSTAKERIERIKRLVAAIEKNEADLVNAVYTDFRKPPQETTATEILSSLMDARHAIAHLPNWMKPRKVGTPAPLIGSRSYIHYEPKGVALIIAPWNYPIYLTLGPLIYALAAGCTAFVKPSELTPHTAAAISGTIAEAFPPQEVVCVEGGPETAQALLELPFNHIFFTGSPAVGKIVMQAAAKHLASVTLELGGKSPVVVDETADLQDAAQKIIWGKLINCGQTCIAPDYVLVHRQHQEALISQMKNVIEQFYNSDGKGIANSTCYARIVNARHFHRIDQLITDALDKGAQIAVGGNTIAQERFIEPTILKQVTPDMKIMQEEIFGPVLPVLAYDQLSKAIEWINGLAKPLALYIFSKKKEHINRILQETSAGGTCINDCIVHLVNNQLPFGGVNHSGIGKTHGFYGFEAFSNARAVLRQRVGFTSVKALYPPYSSKTHRMLQLMRRFFA
ncbi:MAG: aldehyde dehydrogenase family protein [Bernardetiaceae bacterium]|nr:aldehyde dehydrogenase family protein [Bernardetiaceae bacterium]